MKLSVIAGSRTLHCRSRNQRVCENIQGFVEIRSCMLGRHARAKTDSMLRYGRIIHRRNPKTASPKFMPSPIHALSIPDDDWHHICCRRAGVQSEISELRVEIIGVLPKLLAQFRLTGAELQRFENRRDHHWWQRTRVNVRMRVETQVLQCLLRTCNKAAQRAERFRECPINEWDALFYAKMLSRSTTMLSACQHRVRFINKNARIVRLCHSY